VKLYIWNNPYSVSYGGSFLYALADNEDEARKQALSVRITHFGMDPYEAPIELKDLGAPDRVLDGPCAEVFQWSE
jgi:hypothetical protein